MKKSELIEALENMVSMVELGYLKGAIRQTKLIIAEAKYKDRKEGRDKMPTKEEEAIKNFFTEVEWDAIEEAMGDYQDHGEEEANIMYSIRAKMYELFKP